MIKRATFLGACALFAANVASADEGFSSLQGIEAVEMSGAEMASIEGKAHGTFPLGALLLDVANEALFDTPAWNDHGLSPANGPAMGNAQVPGN